MRPRNLRLTGRAQRGREQPPSPERSMQPEAESPEVEPEVPLADRPVVDTALYRDGQRIASPGSLAATYRQLAAEPGATAWIGLYRPGRGELQAAAEEFGLHPLAVEDAIVAHQRPKLDFYDDTLFLVLRAARYLDERGTLDFGELHVFLGPHFVLTVRHGRTPDLGSVRSRMESDPELLRRGPHAVLYGVLDAVVDGYAPVVAGLQTAIDEAEAGVFAQDPGVSQRIYDLSRQVIEFRRATHPLLNIVRRLASGQGAHEVDEELQRHLRDVADHATTAAERIDGFRQMLGDILTVNATVVTQAQNEEMKNLTRASYAQNEEVKKISSWAAILFAPTLIGTVYGMNFDEIPELHWVFGYPFALGLMAAVCLALYAVFKRRGWL